MKRVLIVIIGLLAFIPFIGKANTDLSKYKYTDLYDTIVKKGGSPKGAMPVSDDNVNIFMIWGDGCPHCTDFIEFLQEYYDEFPHINLYAFETWKESANKNIATDVGKEFNTSVSGVPFIAIGDKTFVGYNSSRAEVIKEAIQTEYKKAKDKRSKRLYVTTKGTNTTTTTTTSTTTVAYTSGTTTNEAMKNYNSTTEKAKEDNKEETKKEENKDNEASKYILYGLTGVVIIVFCVFIFKSIRR